MKFDEINEKKNKKNTPFFISMATAAKFVLPIPIFWEKKKKKNPPFFISMATAAKFVLPIPIFFAYLVSLDVDVTRNITTQICEVWSEFNIFCTLVTMATAAILNFCQPPPPPPNSCHTLRWIFLQSFMKFDERNPKTI